MQTFERNYYIVQKCKINTRENTKQLTDIDRIFRTGLGFGIKLIEGIKDCFTDCLAPDGPTARLSYKEWCNVQHHGRCNVLDCSRLSGARRSHSQVIIQGVG